VSSKKKDGRRRAEHKGRTVKSGNQDKSRSETRQQSCHKVRRVQVGRFEPTGVIGPNERKRSERVTSVECTFHYESLNSLTVLDVRRILNWRNRFDFKMKLIPVKFSFLGGNRRISAAFAGIPK
jgi:hypothetical protein